MSVFGKTLRHIALATAGFTLGVSQLMAAGISPIPTSQVNGSAQLVNGAIQLTNGSANETGSAFYKTAVSTSKFSTHFTVQLSNASADGFTFCLQNNSPTALGSPGQGSNLGFADIPHFTRFDDRDSIRFQHDGGRLCHLSPELKRARGSGEDQHLLCGC